MNHNATILLYIFIIISTTMLAFASQTIRPVNGVNLPIRFRKSVFFLSFLIAWFFIAFTNIGADYENYYYIVWQESWRTFTSIYSVEPGFGLLCVLIKQFISPNAHVVILVLKTIVMALSFWAIYLAREKVVVGYSVAAFMTLAYLPSFYLISMALAMSIIFVAMAYYVNNHKYFFPLILSLLAAQIHNSGYLFIPAFLALFVVEKMKKKANLAKYLIVAGYVVVMFLASEIFAFMSANVSGFHYKGYGSNSFNGSGALVIILYVPLLLLIQMMRRYGISDTQRNCMFIFTLSSLFFNVMSYRFEVIERMEFLLLSLYVLFVPEVLMSTNIIKHGNGVRYKTLTGILYILYLLFRFYLVFSARTSVASGLSQYVFFNPFS